jgi:hypothetical protein
MLGPSFHWFFAIPALRRSGQILEKLHDTLAKAPLYRAPVRLQCSYCLDETGGLKVCEDCRGVKVQGRTDENQGRSEHKLPRVPYLPPLEAFPDSVAEWKKYSAPVCDTTVKTSLWTWLPATDRPQCAMSISK